MNTPAPNTVVDELRQRIQRLAGAPIHGRDVLPFGIDVIDRVLPGGGLPLRALHEVAGGGNGAIDARRRPFSPPESLPAPRAKCCGA
jgi:protein ImuA